MIFYSLADFVCRVHIASMKRIITVSVLFTKLNLRLLSLLNNEGFIEGFRVIDDFILIFLRNTFLNMFMLFRYIQLLSSPAKRYFVNLIMLLKIFSYRNFSGIFILNSSKGLITSTDSLLKLHTAGENLIKLFV